MKNGIRYFWNQVAEMNRHPAEDILYRSVYCWVHDIGIEPSIADVRMWAYALFDYEFNVYQTHYACNPTTTIEDVKLTAKEKASSYLWCDVNIGLNCKDKKGYWFGEFKMEKGKEWMKRYEFGMTLDEAVARCRAKSSHKQHKKR